MFAFIDLIHINQHTCRFLYAAVLCLDANFRLNNLLVSSYSRDPNLQIGKAYMVKRNSYERYIKSRTNEEDVREFIYRLVHMLTLR